MKTKSTKKVKRTVKAWALVDSIDALSNRFDHAHNVFAPRVYSTEIGAQKVANEVITGGPHLKVVPCEIHYSLIK